MQLTYKELKEAIEKEEESQAYWSNTELGVNPNHIPLLQAAKNYLPILLKQEFIKPNEVTIDEYLGKNFK